MILNYICIILSSLNFIQCNLEGYIVGGKLARIENFPHSAFMAIKCVLNTVDTDYWMCGASILNQDILMTAAHCLAHCTENTQISIKIGHENREKGFKSSAHSFVTHTNYKYEHTPFGFIISDIGLVKLKTRLMFGKKVKRVALLSNPPYNEVAKVAGWGLIDEEPFKILESLTFTHQYVWNNRDCKALISRLPAGCFCAKNDDKREYASFGDSGSALVVRDYIQIGIVSYKLPQANHVIVYTNVSYYLTWIQKHAKKLMCTT